MAIVRKIDRFRSERPLTIKFLRCGCLLRPLNLEVVDFVFAWSAIRGVYWCPRTRKSGTATVLGIAHSVLVPSTIAIYL